MAINIINPNNGPRTKTVLEQLRERMDAPRHHQPRIRAHRVGADILQLVETTPGTYHCLESGETTPVSIHNTLNISLTHCRPGDATMTVTKAGPPQVDIKAERTYRAADCAEIHCAAKHLVSHDAGRQALDALADLFNTDALDAVSQQAVLLLIKNFYGAYAGTVLGALREVSE